MSNASRSESPKDVPLKDIPPVVPALVVDQDTPAPMRDRETERPSSHGQSLHPVAAIKSVGQLLNEIGRKRIASKSALDPTEHDETVRTALGGTVSLFHHSPVGERPREGMATNSGYQASRIPALNIICGT